MTGSLTSIKRRSRMAQVPASSASYRQLWRVVDGAVFDALCTHQDYLTPKGKKLARGSIVKRVTGAVLGYAKQTAESRSEASSAADRVAGTLHPAARTAPTAVSKWRALCTGARRFLSWWRP